MSISGATKTYPETMLDEKPLEFELKDADYDIRKLSDFEGNWTILLFLPDDDEREQYRHVRYLTQAYEWLKSCDAEVIWVSSYTTHQLQRIRHRFDVPFIILSDYERHVSQQYDISSPTHETYATLILDKAGIVRRVIVEKTPAEHAFETLLFFACMKA
jgi:thioredoxin-dependent peroxiredoxin